MFGCFDSINVEFLFFFDCVAIPQSHLLGTRTYSGVIRAEGKVIEATAGENVAQASTGLSQEAALEWSKKDNRRLLHVVYRVGDLDRTIKYFSFLF